VNNAVRDVVYPEPIAEAAERPGLTAACRVTSETVPDIAAHVQFTRPVQDPWTFEQ